MEPESSLPHTQVPATCPYPEPVHATISHFLKIHINIILPFMPGSPKCSLSLRFPHQNPVYTSTLPHTCYMSRPSYFSRFDHLNNIGCIQTTNIQAILIHTSDMRRLTTGIRSEKCVVRRFRRCANVYLHKPI